MKKSRTIKFNSKTAATNLILPAVQSVLNINRKGAEQVPHHLLRHQPLSQAQVSMATQNQRRSSAISCRFRLASYKVLESKIILYNQKKLAQATRTSPPSSSKRNIRCIRPTPRCILKALPYSSSNANPFQRISPILSTKSKRCSCKDWHVYRSDSSSFKSISVTINHVLTQSIYKSLDATPFLNSN